MYTRSSGRGALLASLAVGIALAGCMREKAPPPAQGNATAMTGMAMPDIKIPADADYTVADVAFMQGMIHHHAQALVMAAMAPTHGASAQVALLCKKITISQTDEIRMMQSWLKDRNQMVTDANDSHPMMMPGMLSADQLARLDKARGTEFDKLFLTFMIQHHQGAIKMVSDLFASPGGGQATEMFEYATGVNNDQSGEIGKMQDMLTSLPGSKTQ